MSRKQKLDLVGIGWPVCFLECKRALGEIDRGVCLEIIMQDPDAVEELVTIVDRSQDQILQIRKKHDCYQIQIQKG